MDALIVTKGASVVKFNFSD